MVCLFAAFFLNADFLTAQNLPTVLPSSNAPFCAGSQHLQLAETGLEAVSWSWSGPNGFVSTLQNPVIFSPGSNASGLYSVTITNATGQTNSGSTQVLIKPIPIISVSGSAVCPGQSALLQASGGSSCSWQPASSLDNPQSCSPLASPLISTTYFVTVTGANSCTALGQAPVTVHQPGSMACNDVVNISLDGDGIVQILPQMVLEGTAVDDQFYNVAITQLPDQISIGNTVTCNQIGQDLLVKVTDICSGSACWGHLKVEDKLPPVIQCQTITIPCAATSYTPSYLLNTLQVAQAFPAASDNCTVFTLNYNDTWHDLDCGASFNGNNDLSAYVERKWTALDAHGNSAACQQLILIDRLHASDLQMPADKTVGCLSPNTKPSATGVPIVAFNSKQLPLFPEQSYCELSIAYTDQTIEICDGSYKIVRTWTVYDWCLPSSTLPPVNPLIYKQLIKVLDNSGPQMVCPANLTVQTDPFNCCATADLPDLILSDDCSRINRLSATIAAKDSVNGMPLVLHQLDGILTDFNNNNPWTSDTLGTFGLTACLPVDTFIVTYTSTDDCGNSSACHYTLIVADLTPPAIACDEFTQVDVGGNGIALVYAKTFDDGSYDQCCIQKFEARRLNGLCAGEPDNFGPTVEFCCKDIGDTIKVVMRVTDCHNNSDECHIKVFVGDKIKPICTPPAHVTVGCENFDPSLWTYGYATGTDNCCIDTITHTANYSAFDSICNAGTIVRTFRVLDCSGQSSQCTQRVVVFHQQNYFLRLPNDAVVKKCDGTGNFGQPSFFGEDCELIGVSYEDQIFTVVPDACYKIIRKWKIINWCTYDIYGPCIGIPNPEPSPNPLDPNNIRGPIIALDGIGGAWTPTTVGLTPGGTPINFSTYYDPNANCYTYDQIIKIVDTQDPAVNAPSGLQTYCDLTANDPTLWNDAQWWDPTISSHNVCEGPSDLTITAVDSCSGTNLHIRYLLFLDLDQDGDMETVVNSDNLPGINNVQFGNAPNPNFSGGEPRVFDQRNVPANQQYGFALQTSTINNLVLASVRWNTQSAPGTFTVPELPYGTHKIKWIVEDGCGNETIKEYNFTVKDCKPPTPLCINGLSANIMPSQMVPLWASDFLQYGEDNCTPANMIEYGIRKGGQGNDFPEDAAGNPITGITFDCSELGTQAVELWARDLAGNTAYCETYVIIQDNAGNCPNTLSKAAGALVTEAVEGLEDGSVLLSGFSNFVPSFSFSTLSNNQGQYSFNAVPTQSNFNLTPLKDDNPQNGVSTYDLVLISKHILGIQPLSSPYKMIAADANRSGSITTFDIVELRKLILGIYPELPGNTSWRFVDKTFSFDHPANPFQDNFPESRAIASFMGTTVGEDFVSIKIGDVNGTAIPNALTQSEVRSDRAISFLVEERELKPGYEETIRIKAEKALEGFQFTLIFKDLDIISIEPGAGMSADQFALFPERSMLTVSWNGAGLPGFALRVRTRVQAHVRELIALSGSITRAEAYESATNGTPQPVLLLFQGSNGAVISNTGFELYQNQPNPFTDKTVIGFYLPEHGRAILSITDPTSKIVYTQQADFEKGYQSFKLDRNALNSSGIWYYTVQTPFGTESRKMSLIAKE